MENVNKNDIAIQSGIEQFSEGRRKEKIHSAFHLFLYLTSFLTLLFTSLGIGGIFYQLINKNFPSDELLVGYFYSYLFFNPNIQNLAKISVKCIIIAGPIFFWISFLITKLIREGKISKNSKIRKWITYVILFIASVIVIEDLISLVSRILEGDMFSHIALKMLVDLIIVGIIFSFYFWDMRKKNMIGVTYFANKIFFSIGIVLAVLSVIMAFFVIDSPIKARNIKIDYKKINNLQYYNSAIQGYYNQNSRLPEDLKELETYDDYLLKHQSETMTYKKVGNWKYDLCENFLEDSKDDYYGYWKHSKGDNCFNFGVEIGVYNKLNPKELIKASMASMVDVVNICKEVGGSISGIGGDIVCDKSNKLWPTISVCGPNSDDTFWIVEAGNTNNWKITLSCANFLDCNGEANAVCRETGCDFSGTCL